MFNKIRIISFVLILVSVNALADNESFLHNSSIQNGCTVSNIGATSGTTNMMPIFELAEYTCGNGYYLPANSDTCTQCPANSTCSGGTYTFNPTSSQGIALSTNESYNNLCSASTIGVYSGTLAAIPIFELAEYTCDNGYYLPANSDTCTQCPSDSWCPGGTYTFDTDSDHGIVHNNCSSDEMFVNGTCETAKFALTTTNDAIQIKFRLSASGTFYVDCGDGGTLAGTGASDKTITRNDTTSAEYSCSWESAGAHTIKFDGLATDYGYNLAAISFYKETGGTQAKIASIDGNLGAMFPEVRIEKIFYYPTFIYTFRECTSLTSIPENLFSGLDLDADYLFRGTFYGCTGLTSIPVNLFSSITSGTRGMFRDTFKGCTNISGYIPPTTFAGLIASYSDTYIPYDEMWKDTFAGTNLVTSCPPGTTKYNTGFESDWGGRVSCTCPSGEYTNGNTCSACTNTKPEHSSYTAGATSSTCPWKCDDGYDYYSNIDKCVLEFCAAGYYKIGYECVEVGCGYWSDSEGRHACSDKMAHASCINGPTTATSEDECPDEDNEDIEWLCDAGYYMYEHKGEQYCAPVGNGWWSPNLDNERYECTNKPANAVYTGGATSNNCPYGCAAGTYGDGTTCTPCGSHATSTVGAEYCTCKNNYAIGGDFSNGTYDLSDPSGSGCALVGVTITFDKNGGTGRIRLNDTNFDGTEPASIACTTGEYVNIPYNWTQNPTSNRDTNMTKSGKVWTRYWSTNSSATSGSGGSSYSILCPNVDTTYYAVWATPSCSSSSSNVASASLDRVEDNKVICNFSCAANYYSGNGKSTYECSNLYGGVCLPYCQSCNDGGISGFTSPAGSLSAAQCTKNLAPGKYIYIEDYNWSVEEDDCPEGSYCPGITGLTLADVNKLYECLEYGENCDGLNRYAGETVEEEVCDWDDDLEEDVCYMDNIEATIYTLGRNTCAEGYTNTGTGNTACYVDGPCDDGVMYNGTCHLMCSERTILHAGEYSYPIFADKTNVPSPVLHIKENDTTCYVYMEADTGGEHGLKVRWNDAVYHAIDPR